MTPDNVSVVATLLIYLTVVLIVVLRVLVANSWKLGRLECVLKGSCITRRIA